MRSMHHEHAHRETNTFFTVELQNFFRKGNKSFSGADEGDATNVTWICGGGITGIFGDFQVALFCATLKVDGF